MLLVLLADTARACAACADAVSRMVAEDATDPRLLGPLVPVVVIGGLGLLVRRLA